MSSKQDRNARILTMSEAGVPISSIARQFKLSTTSIRLIVNRIRRDQLQAVRNRKFLETVRRADDPDKKWPVADLIDAIQPIATTRSGIIHHFAGGRIAAISVRELFDLVISKEPDPRPGMLLVPVLALCAVGKRGFASLVSRLTDLDLGSACNGAWREKLDRLRDTRRIRGPGLHAWSKPWDPREAQPLRPQR